MSKIKDIQKWRTEIFLAEEFRKKEFGEYSQNKISYTGYNISYFEKGFSSGIGDKTTDDFIITTLNLFHAIVKNIVPSVLFQNHRVLAYPKKAESQDTAPIVGETLNHYYKRYDAEEVNKMVAWDAYVLGFGVSKTGYATKYGVDMESDDKKPSVVDRALISLGFKKPKEKDIVHPEINYKIISESPYISYVSPFNFGIDPRAISMDNAAYIYEKFRKTVKWMKNNPKYKNTKDLKGMESELPPGSENISQYELDDFKTIELYEIHYRTDEGIYLLVLSDDTDNWREHYHEKSIYDIDGWQYEILTFNKHGHKLYPISDMTKIQNLQDRLTEVFDNILEQFDRFKTKIAYSSGDVT